MAASLELLTDDAILDYSRSDGKDRVLYSHKDLNLRFDSISPVPGGIFDVDCFGSPLVDRCICGKLRQPSTEPCPNCGARVFTKEEALRRFARIELPFYYLNDLRFDIFKNLFDEIFEDCTIKVDVVDNDLKRGGYSSKNSSKKLGIKVFDTCQFTYNPNKKELKISEFITDESKCSYEGLMAIIEKYFPEHLTEYRKLINHYYLVMPAVMRPFTVAYKNGKKVSGNHKLSIWYSNIIRLCCVQDSPGGSDGLNYLDVMSRFKTPGERVRYTALLRAFLNTGKKTMTDLLNTSKENLARELYKVRTKNSARCPIVPSTDLAIDTIGVPRSIMYEMAREGFMKYLQDELNFTYKEALKATRYEAENPETQKLFKEYAEQQMVIVNRQPTLHEYSMFCMKVRLVDTYSIAYPLQLCGPLGADFDGDTVALQLVPSSVAQDTYEKMSPRYVNVYKKNNEPIFEFNHETLNGLAVASEYVLEDPSELDEPRYFYDDYVQLLKDVEVEHKIKMGTPIVFTGKIGDEEYNYKTTSYGRLRISKILGVDMEKIHILDDPKKRIDAKAAAKLSSWLNDLEDGVEKRRELQVFALRAVTLAGVVTFDYKTLYTNTNTELYKEICKIADSKELTDQQKLAILTEKYQKYEKEIQGSFSEDLKDELKRAGRVELASISSLNMPQLIVSGIDEKPIITRGSLLGGYDEQDMIYHSIENRSIQSIKVSGVPNSGYLTRQISFLLNNYVYHEGEDKENAGLLIPRYKALGRTAPNGKVYPDKPLVGGSEDDLVPVRSIITKFKGDLETVTPDLIGTKFKFTDGAAIGLSFSSSLTETTTQSALKLKHGGKERVLSQDGYLKAPKQCTFREDGKWIVLKTRTGELKYPRPDNLVTLDKTEFEKDENVCCAYSTTSPIYKLNALIELMKARRSNGQRYFEKDKIIVSDCYALNDGVISYTEDKRGNMVVKIGDVEYQYNPQCMYYFPDGAAVKKYDRICSGVINMQHVVNVFGPDINAIYLVFRKQFYTLVDGDFVKTGLSNLHSVQEELIELLFTGLIKVDYDPVKDKIEEIEYQGNNTAVLNKKSFYTILSYGFSSKVVGKALKGDLNLDGDVMTDTVLGLLLNDKIN